MYSTQDYMELQWQASHDQSMALHLAGQMIGVLGRIREDKQDASLPHMCCTKCSHIPFQCCQGKRNQLQLGLCLEALEMQLSLLDCQPWHSATPGLTLLYALLLLLLATY